MTHAAPRSHDCHITLDHPQRLLISLHGYRRLLPPRDSHTRRPEDAYDRIPCRPPASPSSVLCYLSWPVNARTVHTHRESTNASNAPSPERAVELAGIGVRCQILDQDLGKVALPRKGRGVIHRLMAAVGLGEVGGCLGLGKPRAYPVPKPIGISSMTFVP